MRVVSIRFDQITEIPKSTRLGLFDGSRGATSVPSKANLKWKRKHVQTGEKVRDVGVVAEPPPIADETLICDSGLQPEQSSHQYRETHVQALTTLTGISIEDR